MVRANEISICITLLNRFHFICLKYANAIAHTYKTVVLVHAGLNKCILSMCLSFCNVQGVVISFNVRCYCMRITFISILQR